MPIVFILNGPNLNLLGVREPATYGYDTLADVEQRCLARAAALDLTIDFRQTNHEGQLVDWIHEAREAAEGIIINAGALTHTSVAILDALNAADLPVIEVHLSNIFRREPFRHISYVSLAARGVICGLGPQGYELALEALASVIEARTRPTVRRLPASRSPGFSRVTSLIFTFSDGNRPTLVEPAIVSRYPVSRSTRAWIAEVRKPDGIPINSSNARTTMTAATAAPAIFSALMTTFQTAPRQTALRGIQFVQAPSGPGVCRAYPGKRKRLKGVQK